MFLRYCYIRRKKRYKMVKVGDRIMILERHVSFKDHVFTIANISLCNCSTSCLLQEECRKLIYELEGTTTILCAYNILYLEE